MGRAPPPGLQFLPSRSVRGGGDTGPPAPPRPPHQPCFSSSWPLYCRSLRQGEATSGSLHSGPRPVLAQGLARRGSREGPTHTSVGSGSHCTSARFYSVPPASPTHRYMSALRVRSGVSGEPVPRPGLLTPEGSSPDKSSCLIPAVAGGGNVPSGPVHSGWAPHTHGGRRFSGLPNLGYPPDTSYLTNSVGRLL